MNGEPVGADQGRPLPPEPLLLEPLPLELDDELELLSPDPPELGELGVVVVESESDGVLPPSTATPPLSVVPVESDESESAEESLPSDAELPASVPVEVVVMPVDVVVALLLVTVETSPLGTVRGGAPSVELFTAPPPPQPASAITAAKPAIPATTRRCVRAGRWA